MSWQHACGVAVAESNRTPLALYWTCVHPTLTVAKVDAGRQYFEHASDELAHQGWSVTVRNSGGTAFPVGPGTVQLAMVHPWQAVGGPSSDVLYTIMSGAIVESLADLGVQAAVGTVENAFCRGRYDIAVDRRKVAGISQAWRNVAGNSGYQLVAATLLVNSDCAADAAIVNRFYRTLGRPISCSSRAITTVNLEQYV